MVERREPERIDEETDKLLHELLEAHEVTDYEADDEVEHERFPGETVEIEVQE